MGTPRTQYLLRQRHSMSLPDPLRVALIQKPLDFLSSSNANLTCAHISKDHAHETGPYLCQERLVRNHPHTHMSERFGYGITCFVGGIGCGSCCKLSRMVSPSEHGGDGYKFRDRSSDVSSRTARDPSAYKIQGGVRALLTPVSNTAWKTKNLHAYSK